MHPTTAPLTLEELALFNELFIARFGLHFPDHKREILESRLLPRLRANHLKRYIDYYLLLQYDYEREKDHLIRAITNNESYFFRETSQIEVLQGAAGTELRAGGILPGRLRILSAGCSSGEEPYTLRIFEQRSPFGRGEPAHIDAVDIDSERLERARQAVYRPSSLRVLTPAQIRCYFERLDEESYALRAPFRQGVRFRLGNLVDLDSLRGVLPYDAVFCRNVLIYFAEPALKKAIDNFAHLVRPGGLLFLGHSESIIGLTQSFKAERLGQCIAYRREGT